MRLASCLLVSTLFSIAACSPQDRAIPTVAAVQPALDSLIDQTMAGAAALDADVAFAHASGGDSFTFMTNDQLGTGLDSVRENFRRGYKGLRSQEVHLARRHVSVLSPTVAIYLATGTAAYTDTAGTTHGPSPYSFTAVFVRDGGHWRWRHVHQWLP